MVDRKLDNTRVEFFSHVNTLIDVTQKGSLVYKNLPTTACVNIFAAYFPTYANLESHILQSSMLGVESISYSVISTFKNLITPWETYHF